MHTTEKVTDISLSKVFSLSWDKVRKHISILFLSQLAYIGCIIGIMIVSFIVMFGAILIAGENSPLIGVFNMIFQIASGIFGIWIGFGFILQANNILQHNKAKVEDIFSASRSMIGQGIGMQILLGIAFVVGLLVIGGIGLVLIMLLESLGETTQIIVGLLIGLPTLIVILRLSLRLSMTQYAIILDGYEILDALQYSRKITQGRIGTILLLGIINIAILFIGTIALLIGLIRAWPTVVIAGTKLYLELDKTYKNN